MFNNKFMRIALDIAAQATEEVPVGAIIVDSRTNKIIAKEHNLVELRQDPTAHAEMLAIQTACKDIANKSLHGFDLYVTLQPCAMCLQAAIYAKIRRIYFGAYDKNIILELPKSSNHQIEIYGGVCEVEAKALLDDFFAAKRQG